MKTNTNRSPASIRGGWEPMPSDVWRDISEILPLPWTDGQAAHDLRVYAAEVRLNRRRKMPGRPALASRWGWTDHRVRTLLRDEACWMLNEESPAHRQRIASASPESSTESQVEPSSVASPSPARRQPTSTRAQLQTSDNRPQTENTPHSPPPGGAPVDKAEKPVGKPRRSAMTLEQIAAVDVPADLAALDGWRDAWMDYAAHRQGLKPAARWKDATQIDRMTADLLRKHRAGMDVVEALRQSAVNGWQGVFPKPRINKPRQMMLTASKSEISVMTLPAPQNASEDGQEPAAPVLEAPATPEDAWSVVLEALSDSDVSSTPPDVITGWLLWPRSKHPGVHEAMMEALCAATECPGERSHAWYKVRRAHCDPRGYDLRQIASRFRKTYPATWQAARGAV